MRHEEFVEQVAERLESMAEATADEEARIGYGITMMRAFELRVAACVVRDLSQVASQKKQEKKRFPLEVPS